jgi:hypothetical protein
MQVAQQFAMFFFHKGRQKGLFKKNKAKRVQATNVTRSTLMGRHHGGFGAGLGPLATTQGEGRPPRGHAVVRSFSQGRRRRSRLVLRRRRAPGDAGQVLSPSHLLSSSPPVGALVLPVATARPKRSLAQ